MAHMSNVATIPEDRDLFLNDVDAQRSLRYYE